MQFALDIDHTEIDKDESDLPNFTPHLSHNMDISDLMKSYDRWSKNIPPFPSHTLMPHLPPSDAGMQSQA